MSSENEKKSGEPGSGPKTEPMAEIVAAAQAGTLLVSGECAECGLPIRRLGAGWLHDGPNRHFDHFARPKARIVETGYVGAERKSYLEQAEAVAMAEFPPAGMDGQTGVCKICERGLVWDGNLGVWRHSAAMEGRETAHVGVPKVAKCPHCQHFGPVDHECSHETCQNCGLALDEPPAVEPADGKMSAAEVREVREIETAAGGSVAPPGPERLPCECWRMAGFRNCPRHRNLCEPPDSPAFQTGVSNSGKSATMLDLAKSGAPGTDMRLLGPEEKIEPGDVGAFAAGHSPVSAAMVGDEAGLYDPIQFFRGVPLGEPRGAEGEPGIGECATCKQAGRPRCVCGEEEFADAAPGSAQSFCAVCGIPIESAPRGFVRGAPKGVTPALWQCPEHLGPLDLDDDSRIFAPAAGSMPSWFPEMLGQARAADLADAGHRLAKCGVCGRLLYEKSGVFIHDGSGVEHVGVPTEIFDPAPANTAGVCFTCPPVGFFEALLNRLFPQDFPKLPEVEWAPPNAAPKGDVIHLTAVTEFSILDRLRLIVSGRLMTRAMIVCENEAGRTKSVMTVRPLAPGRGNE